MEKKKSPQYVSDVPELMSQWDTEKNTTLSPENVTSGSKKKAWWLCEKGHSWEAIIGNRLKGRGCPYCAGKKVLAGYNDVATTHPEILALWSDKNTFSPQEVSAGSKKKALWCCDSCHNTWEAAVQKIAIQKTRCPYCSSNKTLSGFNDLATLNPDVAEMWDEKKNGIPASQVAPKSNKKFWWIKDGSSWEETPMEMVRRSHTSAKIPLSQTHSHLIKEWDPSNTEISPGDVTRGSHTVVTWKCDEGHTWEDPVYARTNPTKPRGCPYCAGRRVVVGKTDLATTHPHIKGAFVPCTDEEFDLSTISQGSAKQLEWRCNEGHAVVSPIAVRVKWVDGCPHCAQRAVSSQEKEIAEFVASIVGEDNVITNTRTVISPKELDIYIPSKNIAIEFNGLYWHTESAGKDRYYHYDKWRACADQGIQLITIWEDQWRDKPEVVKSMLAHKLGSSIDRRVFARATSVVGVDKETARRFCDAYHIQGYAPGSVYLGLEDTHGDLVALSVWRKNKSSFYLERYCTSVVVVGGMGKLLQAGVVAARDHGCAEIVTFSDHEVSDGGLYEKLGFTFHSTLAPDYRYLVEGARKHKFGYRKGKFFTDPSLIYLDGFTERELAEINGLERIWDCGKTRWVMKVGEPYDHL